jgi:hypothetical protein
MIEINDSLGLSEAMNYMVLNYQSFDCSFIRMEVLRNFGEKAFISNVNNVYDKTLSNFNSRYLLPN